jgi:hypothetical protein
MFFNEDLNFHRSSKMQEQSPMNNQKRGKANNSPYNISVNPIYVPPTTKMFKEDSIDASRPDGGDSSIHH